MSSSNPGHNSTADSQFMPMEAIGQSEAFLEFQERLSKVAPIPRPVLLLGERGTGKELAATRLHYLSRRWEAPLVTLNCAALSASLIETELFGHEKGAFTGATGRRSGRFEAAHEGTLLLDEIGAIPMQVQEKILRVVEYGTFERVGGSSSIEVDVRIIGATNEDLIEKAEKAEFKRDLLDRLSFEVLILPPLRARKEDILLLANHFALRMAYELGWENSPVFSETAQEMLENHSWPGNVRELKNVVERAVYRSDSEKISQITFNPFHSPYKIQAPSSEKDKPVESDAGSSDGLIEEIRNMPLKTALKTLEIQMMKSALQSTKYNQKMAAEKLGLTYDQFRGIRRKYGKAIA